MRTPQREECDRTINPIRRKERPRISSWEFKKKKLRNSFAWDPGRLLSQEEKKNFESMRI